MIASTVLRTITVALFTVAVLPACHAQSASNWLFSPSIRTAVNQVSQLRKAGKYADALKRLDAAQKDAATDSDRQALDFARSDLQSFWGWSLLQHGSFQESLSHNQLALSLDRRYTSRKWHYAFALAYLGLAHRNLKQYPQAIGFFQQALAIRQEIKDRDGEARALQYLGQTYSFLKQQNRAIEFYEKALAAFRKKKNRAGEAGTLLEEGLAYTALHHPQRAIACYNTALPLFRSLKNRAQEAWVLNNLGVCRLQLDQYEQAVNLNRQALAIFLNLKNKGGEVKAYRNLGDSFRRQQRFEEAIHYYQQSLSACRIAKDKSDAGSAYSGLGIVYDDLTEYEKAIHFYEQAITARRDAQDKDGEAWSLHDMGIACSHLGQDQRSLQVNERALALFHAANDQSGVANALLSLGLAQDNLHHYELAISSNKQALPLFRALRDRRNQGSILNNLGLVYAHQKQYQRAIPFYEQALLLHRAVRNRQYETRTLNNLAVAYRSLNQYERAIGYFQQVLRFRREVGDRRGEASALSNLGGAYLSLKQYEPAIQFYEQALPVERGNKASDAETKTLASLMTAWSATDNPHRDPALAIYFGKQAANHTETASTSPSACRDLADLLITEGRLPEAQQALDLLKEQEYLPFVRHDAKVAASLGHIENDAEENKADAAVRAANKQIVQLAARCATLQEEHKHVLGSPRHAEVDRQITEANKQHTALVEAFPKALDALSPILSPTGERVIQKYMDLKDTTALIGALTTLSAETHHPVVAVYTLVGEKTLRFLVYTGGATRGSRKYTIGAEALRHKVAAFREAVQDPKRDPRPLGKEMYDILIAPVAHDIESAQASEVLWSLDGPLRYLPLAALSPDGTHYLIEQPICHALFTPATLFDGRLIDKPADKPTVLALSASTQTVLRRELAQQSHSVVQLASQFHLRPGDETASQMLLGDGSVLPLAALRDKTSGSLFKGVDLLTLSANDTVIPHEKSGGNPNGSEVESLGVWFQKQGAQAVLMSLWPSADASTPTLLQTFYRLRQEHPDLPKAEALRQAQLSLLSGSRDQAAPTPDTTTPPPFAHPYYWASLLLTGNPR